MATFTLHQITHDLSQDWIDQLVTLNHYPLQGPTHGPLVDRLVAILLLKQAGLIDPNELQYVNHASFNSWYLTLPTENKIEVIKSKIKRLDKVRGMFIGVFLGDALGAPHEFYKEQES